MLRKLEQAWLFVLVGLPAAGKSSFARKLKATIESQVQSQIVEIVDTDQIRRELFGNEFQPDQEDQVLHEKDSRIKNLLQHEPSKIVVSDDMNYLTTQRHRLKEIAHEVNAKYLTLYLSTPLSVALQWNQQRKSPVPELVILRINEKVDPPGKKYAWDEAFLSFDLSIVSTEAAVTLFLEAWNKFRENIPREKQDAETSPQTHVESHEGKNHWEKMTRQILTQYYDNELPETPNKTITQYLNSVEQGMDQKIQRMKVLNVCRKEFLHKLPNVFLTTNKNVDFEVVLAKFCEYLQKL